MTALRHRVAVSLRLGWPASLLGLGGGALAQALLPLKHAWLAGAVAVLWALLAVLLLAPGPAADAGLPPRAQVERWGTAGQFGHAFLTAALGLAGLWLGAASVSALGL